MYPDIRAMFEKLKAADASRFYEFEADFFRYFYADAEKTAEPFVNAFLTVSDWFGTSERSGVWTFYEAADPEKVQRAAEYLHQTGDAALAAMLRKGMHDYQNPVYAESLAYPEEWITESEEIDAWIQANRAWLSHWLYQLLLTHEEQILSLSDQTR